MSLTPYFYTEARGSSQHLLKVGSKRRRTRAQIEDEREEALIKKQAIQEKLERLEALERRTMELEKRLKDSNRKPGLDSNQAVTGVPHSGLTSNI